MLDELLGKLMHACYGETWPTKFGGASAMVILGRRWAPLHYILEQAVHSPWRCRQSTVAWSCPGHKGSGISAVTACAAGCLWGSF